MDKAKELVPYYQTYYKHGVLMVAVFFELHATIGMVHSSGGVEGVLIGSAFSCFNPI